MFNRRFKWASISFIRRVTPLLTLKTLTALCARSNLHKYSRQDYRSALLILSGIEPNPGAHKPRFLCGICGKACKTESIACDECDEWIHRVCIGMSSTEFSRLGKCEDAWNCLSCQAANKLIYSVPSDEESSLINTPESVVDHDITPHLDSTFDASTKTRHQFRIIQ